jgi:hypothetical protein
VSGTSAAQMRPETAITVGWMALSEKSAPIGAMPARMGSSSG